AAVQGDMLLVAAQSGDEGEPESTISGTLIAAYDLADGHRRWRTAVRSGVPVNLTQLCGHPQYIPVLLDRAPGALLLLAGGGGYAAIQLIDKKTGDTSEPRRIDHDERDGALQPAPGECELYLLVTPTRMIVQMQGNLIAYGNPPESSEP